MGYRDKFQQACAVPGSFPPQCAFFLENFRLTIFTAASFTSILQYHYRPGTITAFLSRILDRHAKRRRGAILRLRDSATAMCKIQQLTMM